jgi:hypothetical protein
MYGMIVSVATGLHIIIYLIGKVIFGFIRRSNQKEKEKEKTIAEVREIIGFKKFY